MGLTTTGRRRSATLSDERRRLGARVLLCLSFPTAYQGRLAAGLRLLDRADELLTGDLDRGLHGSVAAQRGVLLVYAGRVEDALRQLDRAVTLAEHATADTRIRTWMNRAETLRLLGRLRPAQTDLGAALALARETGDRELELQATHNLGQVTFLAGDLPRALALMPEVADLQTPYEQGVVGSERAQVLLAAGLTDDADQALVEACTALATTDYGQLLGEAELTRAEASLVKGDAATAEALARTAAKRFDAEGNGRLRAQAALVELRAQFAQRAGPANGQFRARQLAAELDRHGLVDAARSARLLAAEADLDGALDVTVRRGEPIALRLHVRLVRAQGAFRAGDRTRGRREARTGLAELAAYRSGLGSLDLQTASAAHGVALARLAVAEELVAGRADRILDWLERVRSVARGVVEVRPPADPEAARLLSELRWLVSRIEDDETSDTERRSLRARRRQVEARIRSRAWTRPGYEAQVETVALPDLRQSLADAQLAVIFALGADLYGVVVDRRRCELVELGSLGRASEVQRRVGADLDALARYRVPAGLRGAMVGSLDRGLAALHDQLIAPLRLTDRPVVISPPGTLAGLAWGLLPGLRGQPVTSAPSVGAWRRATGRARDPAGPVVAVAGPGLSRAEEEVDAVAAAWPGCRRLVGDQATGAAVLHALDGARIAHLAAHGHHQADSPLFSSLRLADGPLVGYDLDQVSRPPHQVVLSACDLGQATVRPGDEAVGLTRALLHLGTATVVAGVAQVSDAGAAELMARYHGLLAGGQLPAYALAEVLAAAPEPMPFVCYGAGW